MHDDENWTGGFYELALDLGAANNDRLDRAVRSMWHAAGISGCSIRTGDNVELGVEPGATALLTHGHLRGTLRLPSGVRIVCGSLVYRTEDNDLLELYLPLGALARTDRRIGGYPFDQHSGMESLAWRSPLDRWLADVAEAIYTQVPFRKALIGFEIDDEADVAGNERFAAVARPTCREFLQVKVLS
jgi:hypothetical protein